MKKLNQLIASLILCIGIFPGIHAQVGIGVSTPNASAQLDVSATNKGVLLPRLSTIQRMAIANPAAGLMVFDSTEKTIYMFDGHQWLGFAGLTNQQRPANNFTYAPDVQDTLLDGYCVSMWDQYAAVGAPYKRIGGIYTGAVYIYQNIGGSWQLSTTLTPPIINDLSYFGTSVCIKGNYLIVGAYGQKNLSNQAVGAAYIYYFNGSAWTLQQTIYGSAIGTYFGQVVAINQFGNYAAISEPNATVSALANAGKVNIYYKPVSTFTFQASIIDPGPVASEYFGSAMAMSPGGSHILVGTASKTVGGHYGNGYVGQFDRSGASWSQVNTYNPIAEDNLNLGNFVDLTDTHAIFGVGKTKVVQYQTLTVIWGGYATPPLPDPLNGISIDPTTDNAYAFAGNSVYAVSGSPAVKIKSLSTDFTSFSYPQLFTVNNKNYLVGIPLGPNQEKPYIGTTYFGVSPQ